MGAPSRQSTNSPGQPATAQTFEWINAGDKNASSRIKAHAIRDYRRKKKAANLKFQKTREDALKRSVVLAAAATSSSGEKRLLKPRPLPLTAKVVEPAPVLVRQVGHSGDPFNLFPARLNAQRDHKLVHHYHESFYPASFGITGCDYSPFKEVTLRVVMRDPAAFLLLLAESADDLAFRSEEDDPSVGHSYRVKAMALINKRMKEPHHSISDGAISACVVLGGIELLKGTPETYKIQTDGLNHMLNLRGGYQKVANSSYQLASLIAWHDFAGVATLAGKRRYPFTSMVGDVNPLAPRPPQYCPPLNVPQEPLPPNYTIYEDLLIILDGLSNASVLARIPDGTDEARRDRHEKFVQSINNHLMRTRPNVKEKSIPARRFLIEDSIRLGALIYLAAICKSGVDLKTAYQLFLAGLASKMGAVTQKTPAWVGATENLVIHLMTGRSVYQEPNISNVVQVLEVWSQWDWATWNVVRNTFSGFLLYEESCSGPYQDFWNTNMGAETRPVEVEL